LAACAVLAAVTQLAPSCQRDLPADDPRLKANGTHPWDQSGRPLPFAPQLREPEAQPQTQVDIPSGRGPAFSVTDTLLEDNIPGTYLQVCQVQAEKMGPIPVNFQDLIVLKPDGYAVYRQVDDWQENILEGRWKKLEAGVMGLSFGEPEFTRLHAQMQGSQFLYLWSYEAKSAFWWVKVPPTATDRIMHNRFDTNRGLLELNNVVGASFSGKVSGERPLTLHGVYQRGVLVLRWEEADQSAAGYAAFVALDDWKTLKGVWWIDDYEASPFGGDWNGTAS